MMWQPCGAVQQPRFAISTTFFAYFIVLSFRGRFSSLFLEDLGLQDDEVGLLLALAYVLSMMTTPAVCAWCDKRSAHRQLLAGLSAASALATLLYYLVPAPGDNRSGLAGRVSFTAPFLPVLVVFVLTSALFNPCSPILDTMALLRLRAVGAESGGGESTYGACRLWGAVSWALSHTFVLGPLIGASGSTWVMVPGFALCGAAFGLWLFLCAPVHVEATQAGTGAEHSSGPQSGTAAAKEATAETRATEALSLEPDPKPRRESKSRPTMCEFAGRCDTFRALRRLASAEGARSISFFVLFFVLSSGTSVVEGLVFLFFVHDLGASAFLCGVSVLVTVVFEIPIFSYASALLRRYDAHTLLLIACAAYALRVVVYTLLDNSTRWGVMAVEPLHGVTFACSQLAGVHYGAHIAKLYRTEAQGPAGNANDAETLAQSMKDLVRGLGGIAGLVGGAVVMARFGAVVMYRAQAAMVCFFGVVHWWCFCKRSGFCPTSRRSLRFAPLPTPTEQPVDQQSMCLRRSGDKCEITAAV